MTSSPDSDIASSVATSNARYRLRNSEAALLIETVIRLETSPERYWIIPDTELQETIMACANDRYTATFVVASALGPPDCRVADFTDIQTAINALPPSGGKIFVKAGTYIISKTIRIQSSNVHLQGEGMGITNIVADAAMTATPAIEAYNSAAGGFLKLAADTAKSDTTVTLNPPDAATLAVDDYVLLFSNKSVDAEDPAKHAGEVKQVAAVNAANGIVTLDDQIYDAYLLADSASIAKITMLHNITLSDFSISSTAPFYTSASAFTQFRFIDNLRIERVESHHAYVSGIELISVLNSSISDCYVHHIRDGKPASHVHYGITVSCASQNIGISGCRFSHTRHAVTTGGRGGSLLNGVQRNIIVSNCTSMAADTAHYDTHDPAENVSYVGCVAIGGTPPPDLQVVIGFQMRAANSSIVGCSVLQAIGKGIMIFEGKGDSQSHAGSDGATITGNLIAGVKSVGGDQGVGVFLDSSGTSRHTIAGNVIKQCEGSAIRGAGQNHDVVVSGNVIDGTNLVVPGASISFQSADRIAICGNKIINNPTGHPIEMAGSSKNWHIADNSFDHNNSNSPFPVTADSTVVQNSGYNPVGPIANPWNASRDLTNNGGGDSNPTSGQRYIVRQSPKTIIITGGKVTGIEIDGTATGLSAGVFKLGIGETIAITYTPGSPPTSKIFGD